MTKIALVLGGGVSLGAYTGGAVSAAAVGEIIQYTLAYLDVPADRESQDVAARY